MLARYLMPMAALAAACHEPASSEPLPGARASTAADVAGATTTIAVVAGGRQRKVLVHVPKAAHDGMALVLNLHGTGHTAAEQEEFSGMDATADAAGFVVAYPQGDIPMGDGFAWSVPGQPLRNGAPVPAGAADDVEFVRQSITALTQSHRIDPKRVYVTGYSGGARMASELACDLPSFAAVAPVDGVRFPESCDNARPLPILAFHGTDDPVNPYDGGAQPPWTYGVDEAIARWAAHDACRAPAPPSQPAPSVRLADFEGCAGGGAVALYTIEGMGHEWPGGPPMPARITARLGAQSRAIDANAVMWAFFRAHPLS